MRSHPRSGRFVEIVGCLRGKMLLLMGLSGGTCKGQSEFGGVVMVSLAMKGRENWVVEQQHVGRTWRKVTQLLITVLVDLAE